jgi:hypothetical protein
MIAEIMKFIGEIMGLIKKEEYEKASEMLEGAYNAFLKEDAAYFSSIPEKDLTKGLIEKHNYTNDHLEVLAELFNAEGELNIAQGNRISSICFFRKALILLDFIDREKRTFSVERLHKIENLRKKIEE